MTNMPVYPIVSWESGVLELDEGKGILLWLQYQSELVEDVDDMQWSPMFLLTADKAKTLIVELQKQVDKLEALLN